jgi:hypothetical protein
MSVHWGPLPSAIAALLAAFSLLVAGLFVGISWQIQKS